MAVLAADASTDVPPERLPQDPGSVTYTLSILSPDVPYAGTGTVTGGGISCTISPLGAEGTCDLPVTFAEGSPPPSIDLVATPAPGSRFAGWLGGVPGSTCSGSTETCTVVMDGPRNEVAAFELLAAHTLTVEKGGDGAGTVVSDPAGIDCPAGCRSTSAEFADGTGVSLTPTPAPGSRFVRWDGACTGSGPCALDMTADARVTATFAKVGGTRPCDITGTPGADVLRGGPGGERICGKGGNDTIYGGGGPDILEGGRGHDRLFGQRGADVLKGGPGRDTGNGGSGRDTCQSVEVRTSCSG